MLNDGVVKRCFFGPIGTQRARSLYVKGFGAAAVHEVIKAAMKNFALFLILKLKL